MKVRYTETALREVDGIFAYIADYNVVAAAAVVERVDELVEQLSEFPYLAQETDIAGVRKFPLGRFPYVVYYTVQQDEVIILHIRHGARRPPSFP
jgi:toxin ParE1/3/4